MSSSLNQRLQCLEACTRPTPYFSITQTEINNMNDGTPNNTEFIFDTQCTIEDAGLWYISYSFTMERAENEITISI
jgi:hypothetical protein